MDLALNNLQRLICHKTNQTKKLNVYIFTLRKMYNDPVNKIENSLIPVVGEHKFLGVIFDKN